MVKLTILDSGLASRTGHHFNQDKAIYDEAIKQGHEVEVLAHKDCPPFFSGIKSVVPDYLYAIQSSGRPCDIIDNYMAKSERYNGFQIESDIVLVPTSTHNMIYGLTKANIKAKKIIVIIALPGWYDPNNRVFTLTGLFYQHAMRQAKIRYPQIQFMANSEAHAKQLSELSSLEVGVLDSFVADLPDANKPNDRLVLGYFGHNNGVKRGYLIPPIIDQFPEVDFLIHENPAGSMNLDKHNNLTVLKGELSPESYINAVNQCDIVLLPYDPVYYKDSITNVLFEAICLGKVIVCPHDTLMQDLAADAGVAFQRPEMFTEAISYAILHHDRKREWALNNVPAARVRYNVERYVKWIIGN